jgi:hypothetical protein
VKYQRPLFVVRLYIIRPPFAPAAAAGVRVYGTCAIVAISDKDAALQIILKISYKKKHYK